MSDKQLTRCSWKGCWRSSKHPDSDGWSFLASWGPAIPDGYYCKAHADAIEAVDLDGGFEPG